MGSVAVTAGAAEPSHDRIVSDNPVNFTPNVEDGYVRQMVQVGNRIIAVGKFTTVTQTKGGPTMTRNNIFAFNATSGAVDNNFVPVVAKEIFDIVDAGDGTVYIGGAFPKVNGARRTSKVARIDATTGQVVSSFKSPKPAINHKVRDIHLANGKLYAGGDFTMVAGQPRTLMAALDATTGTATNAVDATFSDLWNGGVLHVEQFDISDNGSTMIAVGNWRNVNGQSRPQIAMFDLDSSGAATLSGWATQRFTTTCHPRFDTYLTDVDIAPAQAGNYFVTTATGAYSGGPSSGTLCDSAARWELGSTTAGQNPTWIEYSGGDTLTQVKITEPAIYVGGHFRWMNNPFASDALGPGGVSRDGLAALDPTNGLPFSWDPGRSTTRWGVRGFATTAAGLWIGHDTNRVSGEYRARIALMPLDGGTVVPPNSTGALPGDLYSLEQSAAATDTVAERTFNGSTAGAQQPVANGGVTWSDARGAVMIDDQLYTGWSDGTLKVRTYDGSTFGSASNVNLHGLTAFANDLPNITGMFFEKPTGRLYYTLAGQSRLFYRYFTPQSQMVGSIRFDGPANTAGVDWRTVSGMFLVGNNLYIGSSADGNLREVGFSRGSLTGSLGVPVSGPATGDGNDYRGRGMFLYAG